MIINPFAAESVDYDPPEYTAAQIAKELKLPEDDVNLILEELGLQVQIEEEVWQLTELGQEYATNHLSKYGEIVWGVDVLKLIEK